MARIPSKMSLWGLDKKLSEDAKRKKINAALTLKGTASHLTTTDAYAFFSGELAKFAIKGSNSKALKKLNENLVKEFTFASFIRKELDAVPVRHWNERFHSADYSVKKKFAHRAIFNKIVEKILSRLDKTNCVHFPVGTRSHHVHARIDKGSSDNLDFYTIRLYNGGAFHDKLDETAYLIFDRQTLDKLVDALLIVKRSGSYSGKTEGRILKSILAKYTFKKFNEFKENLLTFQTTPNCTSHNTKLSIKHAYILEFKEMKGKDLYEKFIKKIESQRPAKAKADTGILDQIFADKFKKIDRAELRRLLNK